MEAHANLSRRERQIMDIVYALGSVTVTEVHDAMADAPARTSVRTVMRILERKGHLVHKARGRKFVYRATRPRQRAGRSAMKRVVSAFFDGHIEKAVAAYLVDPHTHLTPEQLKALSDMIRRARKKGGA